MRPLRRPHCRRLLTLYCALWLCAGACSGPSSPARSTVDHYLAALRSNAPRAAYELLSSDVRRSVSFDVFSKQWQRTAAERAWQVQALEAGITGSPDARELARVIYPDGEIIYLQREGSAWRLATELVGRSHAKRPRDAIALFADAISRRDIDAALSVLTSRRRDAIARQVHGFMSELAKQVDSRLDHFGPDRAELRWDDSEFRYRVILRNEAGEWRIDDIYIRPAPVRP